jgi:hypothetical protein
LLQARLVHQRKPVPATVAAKDVEAVTAWLLAMPALADPSCTLL